MTKRHKSNCVRMMVVEIEVNSTHLLIAHINCYCHGCEVKKIR